MPTDIQQTEPISGTIVINPYLVKLVKYHTELFRRAPTPNQRQFYANYGQGFSSDTPDAEQFLSVFVTALYLASLDEDPVVILVVPELETWFTEQMTQTTQELFRNVVARKGVDRLKLLRLLKTFLSRFGDECGVTKVPPEDAPSKWVSFGYLLADEGLPEWLTARLFEI